MKKIIYIGTDKWAIQLSKLVHTADISIVHAVIPPNSKNLKEVCRKEKISYSEVKNINNLNHLISKLNFDLYVVIGHPYLLRKPLLDIAEGIGFHPSLLPKRRGRAPLNWAIIDGLAKSGVTLFRLAEGADSGLIYFQEEFLIDDNDTVDILVEKVNKILLDNLEEIVLKWPNLEGIKQDESQASYTPRRYPDDGEIKIDMTPAQAERLVRALNGPYPSAFIRLKDSKKLYVHKVAIEDDLN